MGIRIRYIYGWLFVRPRRWFFRKLISNYHLRLWPERCEFSGWSYPNLHWWVLYITIFKFFEWLNYDAWRPFCDWTGGFRRSCPLIARMIQRIGETTAGIHISSDECYHCASKEGNQLYLADNKETFEETNYGSYGTEDGTCHWWEGITTCPKCGYRSHFSDSSL